MKKVLALVALTLLMASSVTAQVDPDAEGFGVFFDLDYTSRCTTLSATGLLNAYVVASNISRPTLGGWEGKVSIDNPNFMFMSATLAGSGPINMLTAPEFMVGLGVPMEAAPNLRLVTIVYYVMALQPANLFVGPCTSFQSIAGEACYADGADPGILVPFQAPAGSWLLPAAKVNQVCDIVAIEDETWGGVKGMFK